MKMRPEVLPQLADKVRQLRDYRDELEDKAKQINKEFKQAERDLIKLMVDADMKNFTKSGVKFTRVTTTRVSAVSDRKAELYAALKANGYGNVIHETVNHNSLSKTVNGELEHNDDILPDWLDGLVKTYDQVQIRMEKA